MADRDPIDRNFLIFCVIAFIFTAGLAIKIFPHPDTPAASTAAAPAKK